MTTRTEYVVFIPDESRPLGRREVSRYADEIGESPGAQLAAEHVAHLHRLAVEKPGLNRRGEAFAVCQIITVEETPLAGSGVPTSVVLAVDPVNEA